MQRDLQNSTQCKASFFIFFIFISKKGRKGNQSWQLYSNMTIVAPLPAKQPMTRGT